MPPAAERIGGIATDSDELWQQLLAIVVARDLLGLPGRAVDR
jgi:hypothetical protein